MRSPRTRFIENAVSAVSMEEEVEFSEVHSKMNYMVGERPFRSAAGCAGLM